MMKFVLLLAAFGVCAGQFSRRRFQPLQTSPPFQPLVRAQRPLIGLLRSDSRGPFPDGSYYLDFTSEDGITRTEQGSPTGPDTLQVSGSYSYTAPDGTPVSVSYVADEFGFRAESPNLPVGPPPPPHALEQIRRAEQEFARQGQTFRPGQRFNRFSG